MMRTILMLLLGAFTSAPSWAQTNFVDGTWQEAFDMAKKQNKYLFIDCSTDWCHWCKVAEEKTFPNKEVAAFMNENFVSVKVDMERGIGVTLGQNYRVMGYPSYLMFSPNGKLVHRMSGYISNNAEFIGQVGKAFETDHDFDYPASIVDKIDFPKFYLRSFTNKDSDEKRAKADSKEVAAWLDRQSDLKTVAAWSVLYKFSLNEKYEQRFLEDRETFAKLYGMAEVDNKTSGIARARLKVALKSKDEKDLQAAMEFSDKYFPEDKVVNRMYYRLQFDEAKDDWISYVKHAQALIDHFGFEEHLSGINNYSWTVYEKATDKGVLQTASKWMEKVVKLDPDYMYLDTYAALLFKSGENAEALTWAQTAIEVGKKNGENVDGTVKLKADIEVELEAEKGGD